MSIKIKFISELRIKMSTLSKLETKTSLQPLNNESLFEKRKINKIRKTLRNLVKEEIASFSTLKVKIYKEEKKDQKNENKIKIPLTFKFYFEDYKRYKGFINKIESGIITPSSGADSGKIEQIDSSDLVNSD